MSGELEEDILRSLRKITRAIDIHSRRLATAFNLTGPQLVCLRQIGRAGPLTPSELAHDVSLSQATITGILARLEARDLVTRTRSESDRRRIHIRLTEAGHALVEAAPSPLQEHFVRRLHELPEANQTIISTVLAQVVEMMGADAIDASPLFATGPASATAEAVGELLGADDERPSEISSAEEPHG